MLAYLGALVLAVLPAGIVWIGNRRKLSSIEVKVDGRLENALRRIDNLETQKANATGKKAPPPVAGLGKGK